MNNVSCYHENLLCLCTINGTACEHMHKITILNNTQQNLWLDCCGKNLGLITWDTRMDTGLSHVDFIKSFNQTEG